MRFHNLVLASAAAASPAMAQADLCKAQITNDDLVGAYTLSIGNAIMTGGDKVIPLEVQNTMPVTIYAVGDDLIMGEPPNAVQLSLVGADEPDWQWDAHKGLSAISSEDFAYVVDCPVANLPRIVGTGTSSSTEGTEITFTYRLIAWSLGDNGAEMVGALQWSGGGISQKRVVMMTAQ
ncbi:hypothetical protein [Aliiroseovarius subalbicans]|uniref:hypothetical protein n=1 Tax=Aliiroseovarius subalbicans TaxID=2925840 RepID=UPI001F598B95|nr:hypothetical protein [Aliiroseovarius subalbicans]MCI2398436.1 hypothetical protein [Aliiroseovarius subalbicans]